MRTIFSIIIFALFASFLSLCAGKPVPNSEDARPPTIEKATNHEGGQSGQIVKRQAGQIRKFFRSEPWVTELRHDSPGLVQEMIEPGWPDPFSLKYIWYKDQMAYKLPLLDNFAPGRQVLSEHGALFSLRCTLRLLTQRLRYGIQFMSLSMPLDVAFKYDEYGVEEDVQTELTFQQSLGEPQSKGKIFSITINGSPGRGFSRNIYIDVKATSKIPYGTKVFMEVGVRQSIASPPASPHQ
ncbi:MAG: hypothetical protein M1833_002291 [Piccolia ochrophora]|nr:MAG: hypothetical protein M1833_002291 [Piccolia ochrophora]